VVAAAIDNLRSKPRKAGFDRFITVDEMELTIRLRADDTLIQVVVVREKLIKDTNSEPITTLFPR
jgi:hypothetical protein